MRRVEVKLFGVERGRCEKVRRKGKARAEGKGRVKCVEKL